MKRGLSRTRGNIFAVSQSTVHQTTELQRRRDAKSPEVGLQCVPTRLDSSHALLPSIVRHAELYKVRPARLFMRAKLKSGLSLC